MDFDLPDDVIARHELFLKALIVLAGKGQLGAGALIGINALVSSKRTALVNAAVQKDDLAVLRLQPAFPGIDLLELVNALRTEAVIIRLGGMDEPQQ